MQFVSQSMLSTCYFKLNVYILLEVFSLSWSSIATLSNNYTLFLKGDKKHFFLWKESNNIATS
jgi:hypothetical protein